MMEEKNFNNNTNSVNNNNTTLSFNNTNLNPKIMKKIIYLSIALFSLSLVSCREQDELTQAINGQNPGTEKKLFNDGSNSINNSTEYSNFNSTARDGDPARPPQD
ncbi:hypothetical protein [Halpernia frigidisoli]|nr:hypothetical protein [Halpernia frigidisoli]